TSCPNSSWEICTARAPSVRSVQLFATVTPSVRLYGTVACVSRDAALVVELDSHALYVPERPAAAARAAHLASAPARPPRFPSYVVLVTKTLLNASHCARPTPRIPRTRTTTGRPLSSTTIEKRARSRIVGPPSQQARTFGLWAKPGLP